MGAHGQEHSHVPLLVTAVDAKNQPEGGGIPQRCGCVFSAILVTGCFRGSLTALPPCSLPPALDALPVRGAF